MARYWDQPYEDRDYDTPEFFKRTIATVARRRTCKCGITIPAGHGFEKIVMKEDGRFSAEVRCSAFYSGWCNERQAPCPTCNMATVDKDGHPCPTCNSAGLVAKP